MPSAKAANDEARARLAEAQAYKAVLDAQSRAADVASKTEERAAKIDDQEFGQVMSVLDQHNTLASEDRDFEERKAMQESPENGEQEDD